GTTGGMCELIAAPNHEVGKSVARVEWPLMLAARSPANGNMAVLGRAGDGWRPRIGRLARRETDLQIVSEDLGHAPVESGKVVLVDPIDEERVWDFELNRVGAESDGLDRLEPGVERLLAADAALHRGQDLPPKSTRLLQ